MTITRPVLTKCNSLTSPTVHKRRLSIDETAATAPGPLSLTLRVDAKSRPFVHRPGQLTTKLDEAPGPREAPHAMEEIVWVIKDVATDEDSDEASEAMSDEIAKEPAEPADAGPPHRRDLNARRPRGTPPDFFAAPERPRARWNFPLHRLASTARGPKIAELSRPRREG